MSYGPRFVEPPWKAVLSNKGMLPLLWQMAPGHPNLLAAYFEDDPARLALGSRFARKPLLSREGANVLLVDEDHVIDVLLAQHVLQLRRVEDRMAGLDQERHVLGREDGLDQCGVGAFEGPARQPSSA